MGNILNKPNGANFLKADIHLHTPFDSRFVERSDFENDEKKKAFIRLYLDKVIEKDLRLIAITEHNDVSWIPYFQEVNKEDKYNKIIIFPGVEIASKEAIHLLTLFEPKTKVDVINNFLVKIGLEKNRIINGSVTPSVKTFDEILELIETDYCERTANFKKYSAVIIAAHIDAENGLFKQDNAQNYYKNSALLAAQISKRYLSLNDGKKNVLEGKDGNYYNKKIAVVESSDARSLDDIGRYASYIKLSSFSVEGLRQAFLDPESRINHAEEYKPESFSKIIEMKVEGGYLNGLEVHFNDNLNCIIGGKGTGKSTILEALRYAFGKKATESIRKQSDDILQNVFKNGSKISLLVYSVTSDKKYLIEATYNEKPVVREFDTRNIIPDFPSSSVMPSIDIYGQKEIYELSNDNKFQFSLLERFYGDDIKALESEVKWVASKLTSNKSDILKVRKQSLETEDMVNQLPSLKQRLEKFKNSGIEKNFKNKNTYEKEKKLWEDIEITIRQNKELFEELYQRQYFEQLFDRHIDYINKEICDELKAGFSGVEKAIKVKLLEIMKLLNEVTYEKQIAQWKEKYVIQNEEYNKKLRDIQSDRTLSFNPAEFVELEKKIFHMEQTKKVLEQYKRSCTDLMEKRKILRQELKDKRAEIFRKQREICNNKINSVLEGILKVEIEFEGNKDEFLGLLQNFRTGAQKGQLEKIIYSNNFTVMEFTKALRKGKDELITQFEITESAAESLYKNITEDSIYDLETYQIPTKTTISLNVGNKVNPEFKDTSKLSVGQRCTALLTLILLENKDPLIIDQPEDDLDKSFIFEDIVKKLRTQKEKRQFIIATHDSNISVLGDAELMIILKSKNDGIIPDRCKMSSIDDNDIKVDVEKLLEGGKEAFEKRKHKYGF